MEKKRLIGASNSKILLMIIALFLFVAPIFIQSVHGSQTRHTILETVKNAVSITEKNILDRTTLKNISESARNVSAIRTVERNLSKETIPRNISELTRKILESRAKLERQQIKKVKRERSELVVNDIRTSAKDLQMRVKGRNLRVIFSKQNISFIDRGITATSNMDFFYENDTLFAAGSKKRVNILPSELKYKLIKQKVYNIDSIKMVDEGFPKYIVNSKRKGKIFGLIHVSLDERYEINAETGDILKKDKPLWSIFTSEEAIQLDEGDACPLNQQNDWCGVGLGCEPIQQALVASEEGECRLFPPAFHGKMVFKYKDWKQLLSAFCGNLGLADIPISGTQQLQSLVINLPVMQECENYSGVSISEIQTFATATEEGVEVPLNKLLDWILRDEIYTSITYIGGMDASLEENIKLEMDEWGNFVHYDVPLGANYIIWTSLFNETDNEVSKNYWSFSVNGGPELMELDLYGTAYNDYNKIIMIDIPPALPLPSPPEFQPPSES